LPDRGRNDGSDLAFDRCKGEEFRTIFQRVYRIIDLQFSSPGLKGIKGFIFYGETGVGKTYMARVLAHELSVPLLFVDSATVARKHYGESERLISKLFEEATHNKSVLLFDDVEALFLDRTKEASEGWNVSQNNVLFHQIDSLDSSRCALILTTNLISFLDKALQDRLYPVEFPLPSLETLLEIARLRCGDLRINPERVEQTIRSTPGTLRSIRAVEKLVLDDYVLQIESKTLSQGKSRPVP
jgi:AAA+ superfamily predicted ATPase